MRSSRSPKDVVSDGNIANLDQVAEALRRAHKRLGTRNPQRRHGAADCDGHYQENHRPQPDRLKRELELQVEAEANQYIPFCA